MNLAVAKSNIPGNTQVSFIITWQTLSGVAEYMVVTAFVQ